VKQIHWDSINLYAQITAETGKQKTRHTSEVCIKTKWHSRDAELTQNEMSQREMAFLLC